MKGTAKNDEDGLMDAWSECPLESIAQTTSGGTPDRKRAEFYGGEIPWVKSGELNDSYIFSTEETLTPEGLKHSSAKLFPTGTLLMAMYGATVGKTAILKTDAATNQAVCAIFPDQEKADADFLRYFLIGERQELLKQRYGGAQPNISQNVIRNFSVRRPPLPEQRKIAGVLGLVQLAMEQQERLLTLTVELKKALLHKLFTEGLRGETQKQTKIGPVPESWDVVELISAVEQIDYGISAPIPKAPPENGVKIVSTADITKDGRLLYEKIRRIVAPEKTVKRLTLQTGDVLFNWRNSAELIGKSAVFQERSERHVFASFILRIKCGEQKSHNFFLAHLMNYFRETSVFLKLARRAVNQANYNRNEISVLKIPLPTHQEQRDIAEAIAAVDAKIHHHRQKKAKLEDLFRTMLHQLMTAQIRVHDLDLEGLLAQPVAEMDSKS